MFVVVFIITAVFIILDMVTGIIKAFREKAFTSSIMREGLFHKSGSILCIVLGALIDYGQAYMELGFNVPIAVPICIYICTMEIGSIIENICIINPKFLPEKIKEHFSKLNK